MKGYGPRARLPLMALLFSGAAFGQAAPRAGASPVSADQNPLIVSRTAAGIPSSAPSTLTIPAGARVMMVLESPLHTTSGTAGSGIYLGDAVSRNSG
jgi:hypothetical protein